MPKRISKKPLTKPKETWDSVSSESLGENKNVWRLKEKESLLRSDGKFDNTVTCSRMDHRKYTLQIL